MDKKNLVSLMVATSNANPSGTYSYNGENLSFAAMNETIRKEVNELYKDDARACFALLEEAMDEILPAKILNRYGDFAEVKTFPQGDKPVFTRKTGHMRAKQFITKVGLAGVYEVFKLATSSFEVETSAIGGAAQIGFEEFLDGRADFAEVTNIVMEGMDEIIYREIARALTGSINSLPEANRASVAGFDEVTLDRVISVVSAYGTPTIYCTREFAVKIVPADGWVSDRMRDERWALGHLANYKGCRVIILPQSFEDETNAKKVMDPGYVWVLPTGGNDKPVKVAFEGTTHVRERENDDWSRDIQVYRKVGVGVIMTNNIGSYVDSSLAGKLDTLPVVGA